jgi:hypothetical protein
LARQKRSTSGFAKVTVAAQHDLDARPASAQRREQASQPLHDLPPARPTRRAKHGCDHAAVAVEHHDRLEPVFIVMRVEQSELLAAMHGIESVVDVEHDAPWNATKTPAIVSNHGVAHAQQCARIGQVLGT